MQFRFFFSKKEKFSFFLNLIFSSIIFSLIFFIFLVSKEIDFRSFYGRFFDVQFFILFSRLKIFSKIFFSIFFSYFFFAHLRFLFGRFVLRITKSDTVPPSIPIFGSPSTLSRSKQTHLESTAGASAGSSGFPSLYFWRQKFHFSTILATD